MEQIRARVDAIVKDPTTAAALKSYCPYGCKRPTFYDEFLPAFNAPHVHLVDTAPTGVREIDRGERIVDVRQGPENEYAEHCRQVDIATAPLRDCISYYNGEGGAEPGSLAYYGGNRWHKYRVQAQATLAPFVFGREA